MTQSTTPAAGPAADDRAPRGAHRRRSTTPARCWRCSPRRPRGTAWVRRGDGLVGWGEAAVLRTSGPDRFADARELVGGARPRRRGPRRGAPSPAPGWSASARSRSPTSRATACWSSPRSWSAAAATRTWVTTISARRHHRAAAADRPHDEAAAPRGRHFADGALTGTAWERVVAEAVRRINAGELEKVVLARDLVATATDDDRRALAAAPAGRGLPDVLDLPRRRAVRRHPGDAGPPRARPGHLARARRHDPPHRRRRRATWRWPPRWPGRRRTSRSTSTPSARSPRRSRRTAPR